MKGRFLAVLAAAALFVLGAIPAQAEGGGNGDHGNGGEGDNTYLALGDSVPFGYRPFPKLFPEVDNFTGYPEIVAQRLHLKDVNATCPGEATGGFLSWTGTDNGCHSYRLAFPLHVGYAPPQTQMEFALAYLRSHHNTRLVTLTLGANDVFVLFNSHPECAVSPLPPSCIPLVGLVLQTIFVNLSTIFAELRSTGYTGLIVGVTYYATNYNDTSGTELLNSTMVGAATAPAIGGLIASGLEAWRDTATDSPANGSSCLAGLLIRLSTHPAKCDVHPTAKGRNLLAGAVIQTIAASCPAHNAEKCLEGERD